MITIDVNLHPFGDKDNPRAGTIARAFIWNEGPVSLFRYKYGYMILHPDQETDYSHPRDVPEEAVFKRGEVDHTRSDGIWWLVYRVMVNAGGYNDE